MARTARKTKPKVTIDPDIRSGAPCVLGTRFPVAQLIAQLDTGYLEEVCCQFDLSLVNSEKAIQWVVSLIEAQRADAPKAN